jgi:hypothetical protein
MGTRWLKLLRALKVEMCVELFFTSLRKLLIMLYLRKDCRTSYKPNFPEFRGTEIYYYYYY